MSDLAQKYKQILLFSKQCASSIDELFDNEFHLYLKVRIYDKQREEPVTDCSGEVILVFESRDVNPNQKKSIDLKGCYSIEYKKYLNANKYGLIFELSIFVGQSENGFLVAKNDQFFSEKELNPKLHHIKFWKSKVDHFILACNIKNKHFFDSAVIEWDPEENSLLMEKIRRELAENHYYKITQLT